MIGASATPGGIAVENRHIVRVLAQLAEERAARITVLNAALAIPFSALAKCRISN